MILHHSVDFGMEHVHPQKRGLDSDSFTLIASCQLQIQQCECIQLLLLSIVLLVRSVEE